MIQENLEQDEYVLDGTLISGNRSLIISIVCLFVLIWLAATGFTTLAASLLIVFVLLVAYRTMRPLGGGWHERVQLVITKAGLTIIRANGRSYLTDWSTFESVQLDELSFSLPHSPDTRQFKLTFINAYKPTISAFIHTRTAEKAIFLMPVEFAFEAPLPEATMLRDALVALIQSREEPDRGVHRESPDPNVLFRLNHCMQCLYSLTGLSRDGACPECGWTFDRSMFLLDGQVHSRSKATATTRILGIVTALGSVMASISSPTVGMLWFVVGITVLAIIIPAVLGRRGALRFLATARGIEEWRGTRHATSYAWNDLGTFHTTEDEFAQSRFALWNDVKDRVRLGRLFRVWITSPAGKPVVDISLRATPEAGRMICHEIERRWADAKDRANGDLM